MKKQIFKISIFTAVLSFLVIPILVLAYGLTTYNATNITDTSATFHGQFSVEVKDKSVPTWFEYSYRDANFGHNDPHGHTPEVNYSAGKNEDVSFSKTLVASDDDLLYPNTTYYYHACFKHGGTHCQSYNVSFRTLIATVPMPITGSASSIKGVTAKLGGTWTTSVENSTSVWFQYGTNFSLTNSISTPQKNNQRGSGSIIQSIGNLKLNTWYFFRLVAQNKAGTTYGETKGFKTLETLIPSSDITFNDEIPFNATISTGNADNISDTEATLRGSATPDTEPTTAYFRYSDEIVPPIFCKDIYGNNMVSTQDRDITAGGGQQSFFQEISNLKDSTKYYYCAIVSSKNGIKYGEVKNFTTLPCPTCAQTTATTSNALVVDQTSAYLRGSYSSTKATKTYFEYKTDTSSIASASVSKDTWTKINSSEQSHNKNSYGNASFLLSGLKAGTKYNFKFVAEQTEEPKEIKYGDTLSFTTKTANNGTGLDYVPDSNTSVPNTNEPYIDQGGVYNNTTNNGNPGTIIGPNGPITNPTVGQTATAPSDAIVHYHEGIETVFARQIIANPDLAKRYGYAEGANLETFAWYLADLLARSFGYVAGNGEEIRVTTPDVAAYQLILSGNKLTVYEYFYGKIINIQSMTGNLRNIYGYEYYFKK